MSGWASGGTWLGWLWYALCGRSYCEILDLPNRRMEGVEGECCGKNVHIACS